MSFQIPQFFAWDGLQTYSNGEISSLTGDYVWSLAGTFTMTSIVMGLDSFDEYADGDLDNPNGGSFWTEAGAITLVT